MFPVLPPRTYVRDGLTIAMENRSLGTRNVLNVRLPVRNLTSKQPILTSAGRLAYQPTTGLAWDRRIEELQLFCADAFMSQEAGRLVHQTLRSTDPRVYVYTAFLETPFVGTATQREYLAFMMVRDQGPAFPAELVYMCVRPDQRQGRGIGARLLARFEDLVARQPGPVHPVIFIEAINTGGARAWYERRGYRYPGPKEAGTPEVPPDAAAHIRAGRLAAVPQAVIDLPGTVAMYKAVGPGGPRNPIVVSAATETVLAESAARRHRLWAAAAAARITGAGPVASRPA